MVGLSSSDIAVWIIDQALQARGGPKCGSLSRVKQPELGQDVGTWTMLEQDSDSNMQNGITIEKTNVYAWMGLYK